jgi:hypothetical protein
MNGKMRATSLLVERWPGKEGGCTSPSFVELRLRRVRRLQEILARDSV